MITEIEKKECDKFIFPFGLPYNLGKKFESKIKQLDGNFENTDKYLEKLKSVFHSNGLRFFNKIKDLDRIDFIDALEVQYNYKNETEQNMYGWLNLTYDLIIKGFSIAGTVDIEKQSDFKKWFNEKIETKKYYEYEIVSHIIGQRNNMNSPKTLQPCYHYIKDVLSKYQLNSIKAKEMVNDFKGSFSPEWNKNVIPFIIDYLKSIDVNNEPQQSNILPLNTDKYESKEPINPFKKIFINGFSYELFERLRDEIIDNPKHNYANYSFIICQMINDEFLHETNHFKLIKFLDENYETTIGIKYNQFKFADTDKKKRVYSKLKKEFKPKINSIL